MDIRKVVKAHAAAQGLNAYKVWKACGGRVSKTAVYTYWAGATSIASDHLGYVLDAVGLSLVPVESGGQPPKPAKKARKE